jgi:hypothetical protein
MNYIHSDTNADLSVTAISFTKAWVFDIANRNHLIGAIA